MKPRQEFCERRFSASRFANQGDHLAGRHAEANPAQNGARVFVIVEVNIAKFDLAPEWLQLNCIGLLRDFHIFIHYFPDVPGRSQGLLHSIFQPRKFPHWVITAKQKRQECNELGQVHPPQTDFALPEE